MQDASNPHSDPADISEAMARRAEWRYQMILEAFRHIDEGRFVSHEAIEKWTASLK